MKINLTFLECLLFLLVCIGLAQSLTTTIHGPSKRRYRTPAMAAYLARQRWSVQDLLQLPLPEGIWVDSFPTMKGCQ